MRKIIGVLMVQVLLCVGQIQAQDNANLSDLAPPGTAVLKPRYISERAFFKMMQVLDIKVEKFNEADGLMFIKFGSSNDQARALRLLERIDIPSKQMGIRLNLVVVVDNESIGDPVDPKVVEQLKKIFRFNGYRSLSSGYLVVESGQDGEIGLRGIPLDENDTALYNASFKAKFIDDGKGVVKVEDLEIERTYIDKNGNEEETQILETTLNIQNGDTVIVGSTHVADLIYITIITATVLE